MRTAAASEEQTQFARFCSLTLAATPGCRPSARNRAYALFAIVILAVCPSVAKAADLVFQFTPWFNNRVIEFNEVSHTNSFGQQMSVNRLDLLLSDFALRGTNGQWNRAASFRAFVSVEKQRTTFRLSRLPAGNYDRVRFHIGLEPKVNHSNPAQYGPDHPLNPVLNGLHWSWQDGYVFLALEGKWKDRPDKTQSGYSYHLGNDEMFTLVEMQTRITAEGESMLALDLNLDRVFGGTNAFKIDATKTSTHARRKDPLAESIRGKLRTAFEVRQIGSRRFVRAPKVRKKGRVLIGPGATPYRFTYGRHFPPPRLPLDNPLTEEGVALGRKLFHDPILSVNGKQSCSSCHKPDAGFVDGDRPVSLGAKGGEGTRNSMPLFNLAWKEKFFWDGRAPSLRSQVLMPIQSPAEMHESLPRVREKLRSHKEYPLLFERAFGAGQVDVSRMARALEQFLLTLVSYESRFDRAMRNQAKLTDEEKQGFLLFSTEYDPRRGLFGADCFHCHGGPLFGSNGFFNNGLDEEITDAGLGAISGREYDRGRFSTPSLRNVELTAPYMHDGRFKSLEEVIGHYNHGIKRSPSLDPNLAKHPKGGIQLNAQDQRALVAFLKTLTDEKYR